MHILFLTQILPYPPDAGPKVKTWNVLRYLLQRGHYVTLVSFVRPDEVKHIPTLIDACDKVFTVPIQRSRIADAVYLVRSYFTGRPFLIERDDLRPMQKLINKLVRDNAFDYIHADQLTMVQFALRGASAAQGEKPKVIFDAHNAVWTIVERMQESAPWFLKPILAIEAKRIKRYEGKLLRMVDHVLTVTGIDQKFLEEALHFSNDHSGNRVSPVTVIPIAVDTKNLQPVVRKTNLKNIVTLGTLHYPPNADGIRWFSNEVFPIIRRRLPDAKLTIIGKNPPPDFLDLVARNPHSIKVTGYVPDLVPYLEKSTLMVVPVRAGGGMRVRILEAFAYGMPVVTTTVGLEGIQAQIGEDVIVADTPDSFSNAVCKLLENKNLQDHLSVNARRLAETSYDWHVVLKVMDSIFQ